MSAFRYNNLNDISTVQLSTLPQSDRAVLVCLLIWRRSDTGECFRSVRNIAADLGFSKTTVQNSLTRLSGQGVLKVTRASRSEHGSSYEMDLTSLQPNNPYFDDKYGFKNISQNGSECPITYSDKGGES